MAIGSISVVILYPLYENVALAGILVYVGQQLAKLGGVVDGVGVCVRVTVGVKVCVGVVVGV